MAVTIYHNPRCSKSRQTLALLEERGLHPQVIEYLVTPPTEAQLKRILKLLGMRPRDLLRTKEAEYKQAKLDDPDVTDAEIIRALVKYPRSDRAAYRNSWEQGRAGPTTGECPKKSFKESLIKPVRAELAEARANKRSGGTKACITLIAQLFVPSLFQHSLIKLYSEGALTNISQKRGMSAQK